MSEKEVHEIHNPLPEETVREPVQNIQTEKPKEMASDKSEAKIPETKSPSAPVPTHKPVNSTSSPRFTVPSFTKTSPNDLYRKLLPAVLFVLTFVTVMTVLLIYMDTVALGAQQFRMNMSRDYELARIGQASPPLVAYVRQLHLAPRVHSPPPPPALTSQVQAMDQLYGHIYNGTFIEFLPSGPRLQTTLYLEAARGWDGVACRAAARDYLALRAPARAAHTCLSPTAHPREVSYSESGEVESVFRSRVLCLPLYTLLLAADATRAQYVVLGGGAALSALTHVPYDSVHLQVIEVISSDPVYRNKTTAFLETKNYTVAAAFEQSVMYALKEE